MNRIDYQGEFWLPVPPDRLWTTIERFDLFESWWGWLREFQADAAGLVAGNALHGMVVPPLPYRLRLDIRLHQCDRPRSVQAAVGGDVSGRAALRLEDADGGTRVSVSWSLEMRSVPLRLAARLAYPMLRWGHDQVVGMAIAGFRQRALTVPRPGTWPHDRFG
jgi:hypothetical protein